MTLSTGTSDAPEFYIDACCWHAHGWESAANEYTVQDAAKYTRAQARQRFSHGECMWTETGVWKRYIRPLDSQEVYEWWIEHDDWMEDERGGGWDNHPDVRPDEWAEPDPYHEERPYWQFCSRTHPDAHPVWICGLRADGAPKGVKG